MGERQPRRRAGQRQGRREAAGGQMTRRLGSPASAPRLLAAALLLLSLVGAVLGCSGSPPAAAPTSTPVATATAAPLVPTPAPQVSQPEADPFSPDLRARAEAILDDVAGLRGTQPEGEVEMFLLTREQARRFYGGGRPPDSSDSGAASPPRPRPLDPKNEIYQLLGLIPVPTPREDAPASRPDSVDTLALDNLISQITGFYSADLDAFYMLAEITGGVTGPSAIATMAHEFTHALQDQHYDLNAIAAKKVGDWDAFRAFQAVMEGDAVATADAYLGYSLRATYRQHTCFQIPRPARPGTPFVIERELDTWYDDGRCFVEAVVPQLPDGIAGVWQNLPTTTEQLLHPEKYLAGEGAVPVALPPLAGVLGPDWRELARGTFGEFSMQNLLLVGLPGERALVERAAAGWGGDGWALYVRDDARLWTYRAVWDSAAEADELWSALKASLARRAGVSIEQSDDGHLAATIGETTWRAARSGDEVTLVVANDAAVADAAAAALGIS